MFSLHIFSTHVEATAKKWEICNEMTLINEGYNYITLVYKLKGAMNAA
jgi:hypothetical protein